MRYTTCPNCGAPVSETDRFCKICGAPQSRKNKNKPLYIIIGVLAVCLIVLTAIAVQPSASQTPVSPYTPSSSGAHSSPSASTHVTEPSPTYEIVSSSATTYVNSIGSVHVLTLVKIHNTSPYTIYMDSASFDIETSDGTLVSAEKNASFFPDFVPADGYAYLSYISATERLSGGEDLTIVPHFSAQKSKVDAIQLPITDVDTTRNSFDYLNITGRVENDTNETQDLVYIAVVLFDADGNYLDVVWTILMDDLAPGDKVGFEMTSDRSWEDDTYQDIASYEAYAYPMQYNF